MILPKKQPAIRYLLTAVLLFLAGSSAYAETYSWVDAEGNVQFSDNPDRVPQKRKAKVKVSEDITLVNPEVRASVAESDRRAAEIERVDRENARLRTAREAREEQETKARGRVAKIEQQKIEVQEAKRRRATAPTLTTGGGYNVTRSGST